MKKSLLSLFFFISFMGIFVFIAPAIAQTSCDFVVEDMVWDTSSAVQINTTWTVTGLSASEDYHLYVSGAVDWATGNGCCEGDAIYFESGGSYIQHFQVGIIFSTAGEYPTRTTIPHNTDLSGEYHIPLASGFTSSHVTFNDAIGVTGGNGNNDGDIYLAICQDTGIPTATPTPSNTPTITPTYTPSNTPTPGPTSVPAYDTWCYDFDFANSAFSSTFSTIGNYETNLETDEGYWASVESNGSYKIALSYNPYWGVGFFGRITRATLNVYYPVDNVNDYPAIGIWGYGYRVGWESVQDNFFSLVGYDNLNYVDFNQPIPEDGSYEGLFYAEVSNPYAFQNNLGVEINNNLAGTKLYGARFEGTGTSPFGSSNCEATSPAPIPTSIPTNQPPPTATPTATNTPTASSGTSTPTGDFYSFTFPADAYECHVDPETGVGFYISINTGIDGGDSIYGVAVDYSVSVSENILFSGGSVGTFTGGNSRVAERSWNIKTELDEVVTRHDFYAYPRVWSGATDLAGSGGSLTTNTGGIESSYMDFYRMYMLANTDGGGTVRLTSITINYVWNDDWDSPVEECDIPTPDATSTPTATSTPLSTQTPFPTSTATPSTDGQCNFTNSSFSNGISPWSSSGTAIPGAIQLSTGQSVSQALTLSAATYQLSLVVSSANDGSGAGTASFAYTASLGSLSGSLGSFSLAEFQSSANQRIYTASFSSGAGSSTITITPTLSGSITSVQLLSVCLFLSSTDDGSDDSGSGGIFTYQCGEALTPPPLSIVAIGEWIIFLAKALLQWFECILLPLLKDFLSLVNSIWQYIRDFGFFLFNFLVMFFTWLTRDLINWLKGLVVNILQFLLDLIAAFQGIANPLGSVFSRLFNIFGLLLGRLFAWLSIMSLSVGSIMAAWDASGTNVIGVNLHNCVSRPLESDICAFFYIAENTILSGQIGGLIIPIITAILYVVSILYIVDLVSRLVKDIREGSK